MNVALRKFCEKDIPNKVKWINDSENNRYLHYDLPLEEEKTLQWFFKNTYRTDRYDAVIECDGTAVGVIGLISIDGEKAEYYVTMGERSYTGKGVATQASRLLLEYAFDQLGLSEVYLYTEVDNISAQKLFERCGFVRCGIKKNSAINRGRSVDRYYYVITADRMKEVGR